jgi:hypothetical protein
MLSFLSNTDKAILSFSPWYFVLHRWFCFRPLSRRSECDENEGCMTAEKDVFAQLIEAVVTSRRRSPSPFVLDEPAAVGDGCKPILSSTSLDEPIDAIVYDVHPAFEVQPEDIDRPMPLFSLQTEPAKYKVPQRFGMSAILGIMTALALLFGGFRILNAEPVVYLFFGIQSLVICLAQMLNAKMPRAASVVAGAVMAPLFTVRLIEAAGIPVPYYLAEQIAMTIFVAPISVPIGAFLGYLTGTCAAGIFLVMDYWEPYLQGYSLDSHSTATPST